MLTREAIERREFAVFPTAGPKTPVIKSKSLRRRTPAANGPVLSDLHLKLLSTARALTGQMLVPGFSAYGYYEVEDRVLLHRDQSECALTLLISVLGNVGPIYIHPTLVGKTPEELGELESDSCWDRNSGIAISYPENGILAFRGNDLPHHRPGKILNGTHAVAALCYKRLF